MDHDFIPDHDNQNDNSNDSMIWTKLINNKIASYSWTNLEKMFAINICKNNNHYIQEHWKDVGEHRIQEMMIIAASEQKFHDPVFSFLNEKWKIDKNYENEFRSSCLHAACEHNDLDMIKYLIDLVQLDPMHKTNDYHGNNCLLSACRNNPNIDVIKYLINEIKMDIHVKNNNKENCLMLACHKNPNLDIIKYLATKINVNDVNQQGINCLFLACSLNADLNKIKFLVDQMKTNVGVTDWNRNNCLIVACANADLETIKYLIQFIDPHYMNMWKEDCLTFASMHNKNVDVIQYLIECIGLNPGRVNESWDNCLTAACWKNNNLDVIKFLATRSKNDISHKDSSGNNCFLAACMNPRSNDDIIKYLVNEIGCDVNLTNDAGRNGLQITTNDKIINFLVNETDIKIHEIEKRKLARIAKIARKYDRVNQIIEYGLTMYPRKEMDEIVEKINPFMLTEANKKIFDIDPFRDKEYEECIKLIDQIHEPTPSYDFNTLHVNVNHVSDYDVDFSKPSEILFKHDNVVYHGDRETVYGSILLLNDITDIADFKDIIILSGNLPKNVINQYISSCYTGYLKIEKIDPIYFIDFLKFIDQYPTVHCSLDKIQSQIVNYMERNKIEHNDFFVEICSKYKLKHLYLYMHNKKWEKN